MTYLIGAYAFAIALLAGYAVYVAGQTRAAAARLLELERED